MRHQLELFFTALGFFTRLPVPAWVPWSSAHLNQAARYFSLVGWVVGAIGAAGYLLCVQLLPATLAVLLAMALMVRITGAFHEDGFADACDGLGGGRDRAHALAIMKDSHIGSYGTVGLVLLLASKAAALAALAAVGDAAVVAALLLAQPLSRLAATCVLHVLPYARTDDSGKATLLARPLRAAELACAGAFGALPLLLASGAQALLVVLAVGTLTAWLMRMFHRRLGGYTGDLLGATQQLAELACYAALLAGHSLAARAAGLALPG